MKCYALHKKDGTVSVMQVFDSKASPDTEIPRMPPEVRALYTGAWREIVEKEWRDLVRSRPQHKEALSLVNGRIAIDESRASAIDARVKPKTVEERLAALESKRA